jgi:ribosomal protein L28
MAYRDRRREKLPDEHTAISLGPTHIQAGNGVDWPDSRRKWLLNLAAKRHSKPEEALAVQVIMSVKALIFTG